MSKLHSTAVIETGAKIGKNVTVEAYAIVKSNVTLCDNVTIKSHAYIDGCTTIGESTVVYPYACIGTKTQDLKYRGEKTRVLIGKHCEIREYVTINSSCGEGTEVVVGDKCLIMAYCHVAHNCEIGTGVVMANNSTLAGHVSVDDYAIIGGMTPVHQFVKIGSYAMVGGMSRITRDVPPYTIGGGSPYRLGGLNIVGLKRHNFDFELRQNLTKAFKYCYRSDLRLCEALDKIENELPSSEHLDNWVTFCRTSRRGLIGRSTAREKDSSVEERELLEVK